MSKFIEIVKSFTKDEEGAFASEYAVFLILIAAALVIMITFLGDVIQQAVFEVADTINSGLDSPVTAPGG